MKTNKGVEINDRQVEALLRKYQQDPDGCKSFEEFANRAESMVMGDGAIVVAWCGMFLAIEIDGYTHT